MATHHNSQSHRGGKEPLTQVMPLQEIAKQSSDFSMGTYVVVRFLTYSYIHPL